MSSHTNLTCDADGFETSNHPLGCFLAYVLRKTLEQWQAKPQLGNSARFLLDRLREIHIVDVALPLADDPHKEVKIRCVVRPEPAHAMLLDCLTAWGSGFPNVCVSPAGCVENLVPTLEGNPLKRLDSIPQTAEVGLAPDLRTRPTLDEPFVRTVYTLCLKSHERSGASDKTALCKIRPLWALSAEVARTADSTSTILRVRPRMTGLWQVSGRNELTFGQRVHLDECYVRNWSPSMDVVILLKTLGAVVWGRGAY